MVLKPALQKLRGEQRPPAAAKGSKRAAIVVPGHLGDYCFAEGIGSASETGINVIDLGAPRRARPFSACPRTAPPRPLPLYTPNPRLYPGQASRVQPKRNSSRIVNSSRGRRRKHLFRRPVPNSRLYRPAPPRPAPPPLRPRASWPPLASPAPQALDTASRAALRLLTARLASPARSPSPSLLARGKAPAPSATEIPTARRLVVKLPTTPAHYKSKSEHFRARDSAQLGRGRAMDTVNKHSTSPECSDGNEHSSAPSEFLAEFLSAIMRRQYAEALKYCRLILQYEPHNATARGFYPLLQHKLNNHKSSKEDTSSSEDASPPHDLKNECDTEEGSGGVKADGGAGATGGTGGAGGTGEDSEDAWDVSERSGASCSSLELDSSSPSRAHNSRSTRSSDSAWSRWESSGSRSDRDDNGNERAARAPAALPHEPHSNHSPHSTHSPHSPHSNHSPAHTQHVYSEGDIENDNAAGDAYPTTALKASSSASSSLRRLRAHFACSIK